MNILSLIFSGTGCTAANIEVYVEVCVVAKCFALSAYQYHHTHISLITNTYTCAQAFNSLILAQTHKGKVLVGVVVEEVEVLTTSEIEVLGARVVRSWRITLCRMPMPDKLRRTTPGAMRNAAPNISSICYDAYS